MPISLAQAQVNAQADVDYAVIDNLRRYSWLFDQIVWDDVVTPGTGGGSLTYGYTRLTTPAAAKFRAINAEYTPSQATRTRYTVDLKPLGGSFELDRVLANLGQAATNETTFQLQQLLNAVRVQFSQELILGDTAVDANGFDGLSKALAGTSTEVIPSGTGATNSTYDWTSATLDTAEKANGALDILDEWLALIVPSQVGGGLGSPDELPPGVRAILGNTKSITRLRSVARRAGLYTAEKDDLGRLIQRYGDWVLVDLGNRADGSAPIIPIQSRDPDATVYTLTISGTPTGGVYTLSVTNVTAGTAAAETDDLAYNADAAAIQAAIEEIVGVDNVTVTGTGPWTITFGGNLATATITLTSDSSGLTGGTDPAATVAESGSSADAITGLTDLYAVTFGLDSFHAASPAGVPIVQTWLPDRTTAGAVKKGEVELGPSAPVLKNTKAAAVLRNIKVV